MQPLSPLSASVFEVLKVTEMQRGGQGGEETIIVNDKLSL
jgi:hypothetical protein